MQPGNYGMVIFERAQQEAAPYLHIHVASPKFVSNMNQSNYAALLGFTQGNLTEVSSYQAAQPVKEDSHPQRTTFNPTFKFGPPAADFFRTRVTAVVKEATVRLPFWLSNDAAMIAPVLQPQGYSLLLADRCFHDPLTPHTHTQHESICCALLDSAAHP